MRTSITKFNGKYEFLSNFYPCCIELDGESYPSVEHAYQAAKTDSSSERDKIRKANSAATAKKLGRKVNVIGNWDLVKVNVMRNLLQQKFSDASLHDMLKATKGRELIEGNWWGDRFWGQCPIGTGENWLGKLLMEVRDNA